MKNVEDVIRSKATVPITPEEDFVMMEKLRRGDKNSVARVTEDLSYRSILLFRKRFLRELDLNAEEIAEFNDFFYGENYKIVAGIAKRMAREVKAAEEEKINGRRMLYKRIGHPFSEEDLVSSDLDIIEGIERIPPTALKMASADGLHRHYYIYYVPRNKARPLQVFFRFTYLYRKTIGANLKKIKKDWLSTKGRWAGKSIESIEEAQEQLILKTRGKIKKDRRAGFSAGQEWTKEAADIKKRQRATGKYLLGRETFYSIPYIVKRHKIQQTTLYRWIKNGAFRVSLRYVDGVGKIKLIEEHEIVNIKLKSERKENLKEIIKNIAKEKGISDAGARQVFCRLGKRQKVLRLQKEI